MDLKKDFLKMVNSIYLKIPVAIINMIHRNDDKRKHEVVDQMLMQMCSTAESYTRHYYSFRVRPKLSDEIKSVIHNNKYARCAIVLQGPIIADDNFTAETVKLYKRFYPSDIIIVSTWSDEKPENIAAVQNAGAVIVQSDKPSFEGHGNINFQLVNSRAGAFKARELGVEYICKTRTDQRIYHANMIEYMINLLQTFPPDNSDVSLMQNKRIVCCCMEYGNLFYPFFMSDFFYFGTADEICNLFDTNLDMRENVDKVIGHTRRYCASNDLITEIQIMRRYVRKLGCNDKCTVENYWRFVKKHLICINKDSIGLFWPKYNAKYFEHLRNGYFYNTEPADYFKTYNWDFINWMNLYNGSLQYNKEYEKYADLIVK